MEHHSGVVAKALDELAADLDKRLSQPANRTQAMIAEVREMRFPPELEEKIARELRGLKGIGYRDAQLARISRTLEAFRNGLAKLAIR